MYDCVCLIAPALHMFLAILNQINAHCRARKYLTNGGTDTDKTPDAGQAQTHTNSQMVHATRNRPQLHTKCIAVYDLVGPMSQCIVHQMVYACAYVCFMTVHAACDIHACIHTGCNV